MKSKILGAALAAILVSGAAHAASVTVAMHKVDTNGTTDAIGTIVFTDTARGLLIEPNLQGLTEGQHGTHVHENADCGPKEKNGKTVPGLAAGSHYDPKKTGKHLGPDGDGHLGDLPVLYVNANGTATRTSYAARLKISDLKDRAIVIHSGGDNYSDDPAKLGGGGSRAACGVVIY